MYSKNIVSGIKLLVFLAVLTVGCPSSNNAQTNKQNGLEQYYNAVSGGDYGERWSLPQDVAMHLQNLTHRQEFKFGDHANQTLTIYVFPGDVFDFIGPAQSNRKQTDRPYPVDTLVISTNSDAEWGKGVFHPIIQTKLFRKLKTINSTAHDAIDKLFQRESNLRMVEMAISTKVSGMSVKQFCFIPTDRKKGGTYKDPHFLTEVLTEAKLALGVRDALVKAHEAKSNTVLFPFIGSSSPELRGNLNNVSDAPHMFLNPNQVREEVIKRLQISMCGILRGIVDFTRALNGKETSLSSVGIVLYHNDLLLLRGVESEADQKDIGVEGLRYRLFGKTAKHEEFMKYWKRVNSSPLDGEDARQCVPDSEQKENPTAGK